MLINSFR